MADVGNITGKKSVKKPSKKSRNKTHKDNNITNELSNDNDDLIQQAADSDLEDDALGQDWSEIAKLNKKNAQLIIPKRMM